jgi:hypothetical protein
MEASMIENEILLDPELLDQEETMGLLGDNIKLEQVQRVLRESMVDTDFYNNFDDDFDDTDIA